MNLIRVAHSGLGLEVFLSDNMRQPANVINPEHLDENYQKVLTRAEFFWVERDADVDASVATLAKQNPGKEIQVFKLRSISVCPAGDLVKKEVSTSGVLPVF